MIFVDKSVADDEIFKQLSNIDNSFKKEADHYLEKYTTQIMDSLEKNSKFEQM
jgi:hypothetical protein